MKTTIYQCFGKTKTIVSKFLGLTKCFVPETIRIEDCNWSWIIQLHFSRQVIIGELYLTFPIQFQGNQVLTHQSFHEFKPREQLKISHRGFWNSQNISGTNPSIQQINQGKVLVRTQPQVATELPWTMLQQATLQLMFILRRTPTRAGKNPPSVHARRGDGVSQMQLENRKRKKKIVVKDIHYLLLLSRRQKLFMTNKMTLNM